MVMQRVVDGALREHVEPPRRPAHRAVLSAILAAERLPIVPDQAGPPAVPKRAIMEDREQVDASGSPAHRDRRRGEAAAVVLKAEPGGAVTVVSAAGEVVAAGEQLELVADDDQAGG